MPLKALLKQNGPPPTGVPAGVIAEPQAWNPLSSPSAMNMYSPLTLQFAANAHSIPPPIVQVVMVLRLEVEISQLPQPAAVLWHASTTEVRVGTKAAPPLT